MGLAAQWLVAVLALGGEKPSFPLRASDNGRYFVDRENKPFLINGDTAWSLIGQVSREDADAYLRNCAEMGINSVIATLVESCYASLAPANFYGAVPFAEPGKLSTPQEGYFAHADWVIRRAAEYGILVVLAPAYLGCCDDGYAQELREKNSLEDAQCYGEWVGRRYREYANIVCVWGNDLNPGDLRDKIRAMAEGVRVADPDRLQTYHAAVENSARDQWEREDAWLNCNTVYTYRPVQEQCLREYRRMPVLPFFLFESRYEHDFMEADAAQTRQQAYTALLSGACGHHYGNHPIWHMNGKRDLPGEPWMGHLRDEGRMALRHLRALFESRNWHMLIPDESHQVVTKDYGEGEHYVAAAQTLDRRTVMVYFPQRRKVTIDLGMIRGTRVLGSWFDPKAGAWHRIDAFPASGKHPFCPVAAGDWVLVLDGE